MWPLLAHCEDLIYAELHSSIFNPKQLPLSKLP